jgi:2,5-furandicarboxylate decarboxylase 1
MPKETALDGPFGEFQGNYATLVGEPRTKTPVIKVTAITMRKDALFQATLTGWPMPLTENHVLKWWVHTIATYREASKIAEVKAVNLPPGGATFHQVIAIKKKNDEEPKKLINMIRDTLRRPRHIVIVDEDINVYDPADVEWAIATRVQAHEDIIIFPPGPKNQYPKWGIDATMPLEGRKWFHRIEIPGMEKVDYI